MNVSSCSSLLSLEIPAEAWALELDPSVYKMVILFTAHATLGNFLHFCVPQVVSSEKGVQ